ncbi:MAG: S41 family peptidase, partial [Gemmatimonadales bacterium]
MTPTRYRFSRPSPRRMVAALIVACSTGARPGSAQATLPAADLRDDFALLTTAILEAHAGAFIYDAAPAVSRMLDSTLAAIHDTTPLGFYGVVAGTLARLRDGHTRSLPSEAWMSWYADSARVLPLRVRLLGGRGRVLGSADPRIPAGSELLAIGGRGIGRIGEEIRRLLPRDGYIETGTEAQITEQFEFWYYAFEARPDSLRVTIRRPAGDTTTLTVAAVPRPLFPSDTSKHRPPLHLGFLEDSTVALLRIATFAADEITAAGADYAAFLDSSFVWIRAARSADLILDLRGNDGGRDTYGSLLLRHLMRRPFGYYRTLETRTKRVSFWRHTNVDSSFNAKFGVGLIRTARGTFRLPPARHQNLGPQRPAPPVFEGRVWVLTDGGTFSTAAEFCAVARSLRRATFVGQETGGTYEGNTSGTFVILTLPHSGVRLVIPLVRYALAVE